MSKNTVKTFVLLAGLGGLFVAIGGMLGGQGGLFIGLVLALVMVGGSYWFSDRIALRAAGAHVVGEADAPQLYSMVRSLTTRAGLPMPRLAVSPAMQPNAFATGRSPSHAVVCVTRGLVELLPTDELEGVLAHELMHVRNRDILIGSVAAAIATGISYVGQMAMFSALFGGGRDDDGPNPIGLLVMTMVAPLAAGLIQMAVSRSREFEADRTAAHLIGDGRPLASALTRIEAYAAQTPMRVNPAQAYAWIHDPLSSLDRGPRQRQSQQASYAKWFSTHPSTADRVQRLLALSPVR